MATERPHRRVDPALTSAARQSTAPAGFDFIAYMRRLCDDIVARLPEFAHVNLAHVAMRGCQTRRPGRYGIQASLTPLRFKGGAQQTVRRGRQWTIQPLRGADGSEMLYLLSYYLPRFLDLPLNEKLATVCHELWHIGPKFDGDIRRHEHGRCYAHGPSEKRFHAEMHVLAERWLALKPAPELYGELADGFAAIRSRHGRVLALRMPTPKLILVRN